MTYLENQPRETEPNPEESFLSAREIEVISFIVQGLTNREIARELEINLSTVKNHISSSLHKLNVPDRTRLVIVLTQALTFLSENQPNFTFSELQRTVFFFSKSEAEMSFTPALPRLNELLETAVRKSLPWEQIKKEKAKRKKKSLLPFSKILKQHTRKLQHSTDIIQIQLRVILPDFIQNTKLNAVFGKKGVGN